MKQISSKLNMYVKNAQSTSIINNDIERFMLRFFFCSFGALTLLYVLLLGNMVFNIIERRSLELNARALGGEVGNLELTYLSMSNNVDLALSHSLGFKETKTSFATRKSLGYGPKGEALGFGSANESLDSVKMFQNDL